MIPLKIADLPQQVSLPMRSNKTSAPAPPVDRAMEDNDIAGMEINGDDVVLHDRDGRIVSTADLTGLSSAS
jgi:hypothetical protein